MVRKTLLIGIAGALLAVAGCSGGGGGGGEGVLPGVEAIVFAGRSALGPDGEPRFDGQVVDYLRYVPGGGLYVLDPPTPDGTPRDLTAAFEGVDINNFDISFDATQVVFSMQHAGENSYQIYVANLTGDPQVRQLTFGPYDRVLPVWGPGDQVYFATNDPYTEVGGVSGVEVMGVRADEYNHSRQVSQLARVGLNGDGYRVFAQNLSNTIDLFMMSDGRIGYSRWEHFASTNDVKLFAVNQDGTGMVAIGGHHGKPFNSFVQVSEIEPGLFVGIGTSREGTLQAGALVQLDSRNRAGGEAALDEFNARFEILTPAVPTGMESPPSNVGRYREPFAVEVQGRTQFLVSWSNGDVNERNELANTAPEFGIYLWDPNDRERTLVYDDPNIMELYARPVQVRDQPPVQQDVVDAAPGTPAELGSIDISQTVLQERVAGGDLDGMMLSEALGHAYRVRIIEGFSSEIGSIGMFGLTMHEGAAILGEATVQRDGSWLARVPPYLPYHVQAIDRYGMAIRDELTWIQAMPGESRRCGGCHESRTDPVEPRMGPTTIAQQVGAEDFVVAIPDRTEVTWINSTDGSRTVQDLFNASCVSCHDGGASDPYAGRTYTVEATLEDGTMLTTVIPYLRLTDELITVVYDDMVESYPMSYVTLLYPSGMMGEITATGDVPPQWVQPGFARGSRLIEAINPRAEDDPSAHSFARAPHPADVGVTITREDEQMLVRAADLGGQYYTRRNVAGATYTP